MMQLPWFLLSLSLSVLASQENELASRAPTNGSTSSSIAAAWYTGWHSADFPLSQVSWTKYTHMTYAFAVTTPDVNVLSLDVSDQQLLPQFISMAHQHNVKALLSIGGWTGSRWFSSAVGSAQNRTAFVKTVTGIAKQYKLDGLDFDWEYPGAQGLGCNIVNPKDTTNFLNFLQELRTTTTGKSLILSAAVSTKPFADESGAPSTDVSGFKNVFDYIAIMNYDLKSNPAIGVGSSSPLDDFCAPSGAHWGSATSAVNAWSAAGIPTNQLVLGVPAYGHSFVVSPSVALASGNSSSLNAFPSYNPSNKRRGDKWDGDGGVDACGVMQGPGGVYAYWGLIQEGFLNTDGSASDGIAYRYDDCSETPYVYNKSTQVYVAYDNARSFSAKGDFIHGNGLKGFAIWEAGGDYHDVLLDSIKNATLNGDPSIRTKKPQSSPTMPQSTPPSSALPMFLPIKWWRPLLFVTAILYFAEI